MSQIDPTKPTSPIAYTEDVRQNFAYAKAEIEALEDSPGVPAAYFPNVTGTVNTTQDELNILDGATLDVAELNILDGVTATAAELNKLAAGFPTAAITAGANVTSFATACKVTTALIHLRANIIATGAVAATATICTIPAGYRPAHTVVAVVPFIDASVSANPVYAPVFIDVNGLVTSSTALAVNDQLFFSNLSFVTV